MPITATFGFGENVCWRRVHRAFRNSIGRPAGRRRTTARKWITRNNVKVDRVACPWLIRRFIDAEAEFFFVPEDQLLEVAQSLGAIAFDANRFQEVRLNHRAERCTFEAILEDYEITDPALRRLGLIIRGADVKGQERASPESSGLRHCARICAYRHQRRGAARTAIPSL